MYSLNEWDEKTYANIRVIANRVIRGLPLRQNLQELKAGAGSNLSPMGIFNGLVRGNNLLDSKLGQMALDIGYNVLLNSDREDKQFNTWKEINRCTGLSELIYPLCNTGLKSRAMGEQCNSFTRKIVGGNFYDSSLEKVHMILEDRGDMDYNQLGIIQFSTPDMNKLADFLQDRIEHALDLLEFLRYTKKDNPNKKFETEYGLIFSDEEIGRFNSLLNNSNLQDVALHLPYIVIRKIKERIDLDYNRPLPISIAGVPWREEFEFANSQEVLRRQNDAKDFESTQLRALEHLLKRNKS